MAGGLGGSLTHDGLTAAMGRGVAGLTGGHKDRRTITVLFCDIVNSTQMVVPQDPEDAYDQLSGLIDIMNRHVLRFGGTICQTLGDGIYAVFGAPVSQENHAVRACFAADAIVREVARGNHAVRIGVCSGEVLWDRGRDITQAHNPAIGAAVHLAAKQQQVAKPNGVRLADSTALAALEWIDIRPAEELQVATGDRLVSHELLGVRRRRRQGDDQLPMVGRDTILATLVEKLGAVVEGPGRDRAHLVSAEPGLGKTRLLSAVGEQLRQQHVRILEWQIPVMHPVGAPSPLQELVVELLDRPLPGTIDGTKALLRAAGAALEEADALSHILHPVRTCDMKGGERATGTTVGQATAAVMALVRTVASQRPLAILVEDVQWADPVVLSVLQGLLDLPQQVPLALFITSRNDSLPAVLAGHSALTHHQLPPLHRQDMHRLLDLWLGDAATLDGLKADLILRADGNPFFLVECVRVLIANGSLTGPAGAMRAGSSSRHSLPDSVQALLVARTDLLGEEARSLLRIAAILGPTFDASLLSAMAGKELLARCRQDLLDGGFLEETRLLPRLEYSFHHALLHEAVYAGITKRDRQEQHGRVALLLDEPDFVPLSGRLGAQARHAALGQLWNLAVRSGREAGCEALHRSQAAEAVSLFAIAVDANDQLPANDVVKVAAIDLRLLLARAAMPAGQGDRAVAELDRAVKLAHAAGDQDRALAGLAQQVNAEWVFGQLDRAVELAEIAIGHAGGEDKAHPDLLVIAAGCRFDHGDVVRALDMLDRAERLRSVGQVPARFLTLDVPTLIASRRARCLSYLGRHQDAEAQARRAIRWADGTTHPFNRILTRTDASEILIRQGRFGEALAYCSESLALSRSTGSTLLDTLSLSRRGYALVNMGRADDGMAEIERAIRMADARGALLHGAWANYYQVMSLAILNRMSEALPKLGRLTWLARERGYGLLARQLPLPADLADAVAQHSPAPRIFDIA